VLTLNVGNKTSATDYSIIKCGNSSGGVFSVRGDGQIFSDFGTITTPADYAEMFEWEDGKPTNEDRRGKTVIFDEVTGKIRLATDGDIPFGAVSPHPSIVGNGFEEEWSGKYLILEHRSKRITSSKHQFVK
jgi:hypothetical protein